LLTARPLRPRSLAWGPETPGSLKSATRSGRRRNRTYRWFEKFDARERSGARGPASDRAKGVRGKAPRGRRKIPRGDISPGLIFDN